jgi:hypothetical protein
MLTAAYDYIAARPLLAAVLSALSLFDASNCIKLGHADWFVPACLALVLARMVKTK